MTSESTGDPRLTIARYALPIAVGCFLVAALLRLTDESWRNLPIAVGGVFIILKALLMLSDRALRDQIVEQDRKAFGGWLSGWPWGSQSLAAFWLAVGAVWLVGGVLSAL